MSERYRNTKALIVNGGSGDGENYSQIRKHASTISEAGFDLIPFCGDEESFLTLVRRNPSALRAYTDVAVYGGDGTIFSVATYAAALSRKNAPVLHPLAGGSQSVLSHASGLARPTHQSPDDYLLETLEHIQEQAYRVEQRAPGILFSTPDAARKNTGEAVTQFHWFAGTGGAVFSLLEGIEQSRHAGLTARKLAGVQQLIRFVAAQGRPESYATVDGQQTVYAHDIHLLKHPKALAHIRFPEAPAQLVMMGEESKEHGYTKRRFLGQLMLAALYGINSRAGKEIIRTVPLKESQRVTIFQKHTRVDEQTANPLARGVVDSELVEVGNTMGMDVSHPSLQTFWAVHQKQPVSR